METDSKNGRGPVDSIPSQGEQAAIERAMALHRRGQFSQAAQLYNQVLESNPANADAWHLLGVIAHQTGHHERAIEQIKRALEIQPHFPKALNTFGAVLIALKRFEEAVACLQETIDVMPDFDDAHYNLGHALAELGRMEAAAEHSRRSAELNPGVADTHYNLGIALKELGNSADAETSYLKALSIDPKFANAYNNLAVLQRAEGRLDEAAANFRLTLAITPNLPEAHGNLANVLQDLGQLDEAIASYRRALQLKPGLHNIHSNMLLASQYQLGQDSESLLRLHREWNDLHASPFRSRWPKAYGNTPSADRPIRVGFVSSDLKRHPVGYFVKGLFENLPPNDIETVAYFSGTADDMTGSIKPSVDIWRDVRDRSDDELSRMIIDDKVDIPFDLSGHSAGNRALVFSRKPAPIQISWAGYVSTTGQDAIDYFLSDTYSTLQHEEEFYCEKRSLHISGL